MYYYKNDKGVKLAFKTEQKDRQDLIVIDKNEFEASSIPKFKPSYSQKIVRLIRQRFSVDDELAILRQRDTKPDEFAEYNAYVEQCKTAVKEEQQQDSTPSE